MKIRHILSGAAIAAATIALAPSAPAQFGGSSHGPVQRPVCSTGWAYRFVAPIYRTVTDQIWVAESRELVPTWVETAPNRMEQLWREVVTPGHWMTSSHEELIAAGHYELFPIDPPIVIVPQPRVVFINPGTAGVEGYEGGTGEDLSKFSGLSEWPDKK